MSASGFDYIGAHFDFDYLDDDGGGDDDGGATATFNAVPEATGSALTYQDYQFQVEAIAAGAAQTNGHFTVTITGSVDSISTVYAGGWSETGWTIVGGNYSNTFTMSSVSIGSTFIYIQMSSGTSGTWIIDTTSVATDQAAGAGGENVIGVSKPGVFISIFDSPDPVIVHSTLQYTVTVTVVGSSGTHVTGLQVLLWWDPAFTIDAMPTTVSNSAGFSVAWTEGFPSGTWGAELNLDYFSLSGATDAVYTFSVSPSHTGTMFLNATVTCNETGTDLYSDSETTTVTSGGGG